MEWKKLTHLSSDSVTQQLDLFNVPLTKTSVLEADLHELGPLRKPELESPIEFKIDGNSDHHLDLANTYLSVKCQVKKRSDDGGFENLPDGADALTIVPSQLFLHSLFKTCNITINNKEIENEPNYAYRAFLETLLNYGKEAKTTHLVNEMWFPDGLNPTDTAQLAAADAVKLKVRAKKLVGSGTIDLLGRLHMSLFNQDRYLIPGCDMTITLQRNPSKFSLQKVAADDNSEYVVDITQITLLVRRVKIHPSIMTSHISLLSQGKTVKYPINAVETQFFTISPNRQSETINILQNHQEAKRIVIGLLSHTAKNGSYTKDSYKFHHYNMSNINLIVNGHNVLNKPLQIDVANGQYARAYHNLQSVAGKLNDSGNSISPDDFANGRFFIAFDNTPDQCHGEGVHLIRHSTTTLELTFSEPLRETVSVLVYCEFDDLLEIDQHRVITKASVS